MTHLLAQLYNPALPKTIGGAGATQGTGTPLGLIISGLVGALMIAGFLLSFIFLLTGAISWISSGGDKAKLEKARDQIINAIVGLIIVGAAWALTSLVAKFFGLNINALTVPSVGP